MKLFRANEIRKEDLHLFTFPEKDALATEQERAMRKYHLEKALSLGNLYHDKVFINFYDVEGRSYYVHTTIWAICENMITLKGGQVLPIRAISEISF
ncbi:MAG: hypothetical protein OHK0045_08370 [Raineya sp.]